MEVFSPDGKCQHQLASIPVNGSYLHYPVLAYIDGKILSCAGDTPSANVSEVHYSNVSFMKNLDGKQFLCGFVDSSLGHPNTEIHEDPTI